MLRLPHRRHSLALTSVAIVLLALAACKSTPTPPVLTLATPTRTAQPTFTPVEVGVEPTATPLPSATPAPTVNLNIDPLSGLPVTDPELLHRRVLAIRVGNDPSIRPQEGLGSAEIVYEEVMEGYALTRFTAIYLAGDAERVRPVRSARLSSLQIAPQYHAVLVHSGASDKIRWYISQAKDLTDLDQYYHDEPYSILPGYDWRGRMYTSTARVHEYLLGRGLEETDGAVKGYLFAEEPPRGAPATSISIPYPRVCLVDWAYDEKRGLYLRSVAGEAHLDGNTGEQLAAANVIVLYAEHRATDIVEDSLGGTAIDIVLTGEGRAQLFRDGVAVDCTWRRPADGGLTQYYDAAGDLVPLKPGQTWIELVPTDYEVTFN